MIQLTTVHKDPAISYSFDESMFMWSIVPTETISAITIGCPHDGMERVDLQGLFPKRTQGPTDTDLHVWQIVRGIVWHTSVNAVRGMLPRFILDYNRYSSKKTFREYAGKLFEDTEEACEDEQLIQYHSAYHDQLIEAVSKSKREHGEKAIFFDFHGFAVQPPQGEFDIILGTSNTHTVTRGIEKQLKEFLIGKSYRVYVPEYIEYPIPQADREKYDGGFSTRNIFLRTGVDSIQVEISKEIRGDKELAQKLAMAIAEFFKSIS